MKITFLISTYNREWELQNLLNSASKYLEKKENIKFIIFNNQKTLLKIKKPKDLLIEVVNVRKNIGKTFNVLNYLVENYKNSDYFAVLDDKLLFISNLDQIINEINFKKYHLYTINLLYKNHPLNVQMASPFFDKETMQHYCHDRKRNKSLQTTDRVWIFSNKVVSKKLRKIEKFLKYEFLKNEISISGLLINRFYYKEKCKSINNNQPLIFCEYLKSGCSNQKQWQYTYCPNSILFELWYFISYSKGLKSFFWYIFLFCKKYVELKEQNLIDKKIFNKRYYLLCVPYFITNIFIKIFFKNRSLF